LPARPAVPTFPEGALDGPIVATRIAAPSATACAVFQTCVGDGCGRRFYDLGGPVLPKALLESVRGDAILAELHGARILRDDHRSDRTLEPE